MPLLRLEGPLASAAGAFRVWGGEGPVLFVSGFISDPLQTGAHVKGCKNVMALPSAGRVSEHLLQMLATPARPALVSGQACVAWLQLCPQSPSPKIDEQHPLNPAEHVELSPLTVLGQNS